MDTKNDGPNTSTQEEYPAYQQEDEINLLELWGILWAEKILIFTITGIFAIGSVIFALVQTEIFRSEALLAPADLGRSSNPLASQLGSTAGLLGLNLNSELGDQVSATMAILESREFARRFINQHNLLPHLMAGRWNRTEQRSVINPNVYEQETGTWVNNPPSELDGINKLAGILSVDRNRDTGLITVAIEWHDPNQAQQWVNQLVRDVNNLVRERDQEEASRSIQFLQRQLESTQLVDMQRVMYQLIESQTRIIMLADVREDYVFRFIDPAIVPEEKIRPQRRLIVIVGTFIGGSLAVLLVLFHHYTGLPRGKRLGFLFSENRIRN